MSLRATIIVTGPKEQLQPFRRKVNALLAEQFDGRYNEHHTADQLDYRLSVPTGIPFPPFVIASEEFPEIAVAFDWHGDDRTASGHAAVVNGRLIEQSSTNAGRADYEIHVEAARDGTIAIAVAMRLIESARYIGYALSSDRQAFFAFEPSTGGDTLRATDDLNDSWRHRWTQGAETTEHEHADHAEPMEADLFASLDAIARAFADAWIWFEAEPEIDTALERHRFTLYGLTVQPANLRSEKIRTLLTASEQGFSHSTVAPAALAPIEALKKLWLNRH